MNDPLRGSSNMLPVRGGDLCGLHRIIANGNSSPATTHLKAVQMRLLQGHQQVRVLPMKSFYGEMQLVGSGQAEGWYIRKRATCPHGIKLQTSRFRVQQANITDLPLPVLLKFA